MIRLINEYDVTIAHWHWKFNRRNINKIAYNYDAEIIRFDPEIKSATMKDSRNRLLWITETLPTHVLSINRRKKQLETETENFRDWIQAALRLGHNVELTQNKEV